MITRRIGPVGRYLLVVAAISAVLATIWWSGAIAPRAGIESSGQGPGSQGRTLWEAHELANPGPLPVQVRAIDWTTFGIEDPQVRLSPRPPTDGAATIAESQPFAPLTLQPGEQTTIVLAGIAACDPGAAEAHPTSRSLAVTLDPPAGPTTRRVLQLAGSTGQGVTVPCP